MSRARRLQALWVELNAAHFSGQLTLVPIRITRSRRTYGYFEGAATGRVPRFKVSVVLANTQKLVRETMLHEMIHQRLYELGQPDWDGHGPAFQMEHLRVLDEFYVEPA